MTISFANIASQLQQKCAAGQVRAAAAIAQAFDVPWKLELNSVTPWDVGNLPADWNSSGLVFVFQSGNNTAVALLSDVHGVLPAWCSRPDEAGQTTLRDLARELAAAFFPSLNTTPDFTVGRVENLRDTMVRSAPAETTAVLPCTLRSEDRTAVLWVLWPTPPVERLNLENRIAGQTEQNGQSTGAHSVPENPSPATSRRAPPRYQDLEEGIGLLPTYSRSLLRIRVPVTVTLAAARQSLHAILNIGSGSIIHFNKSCEDTLTLEVAGQKVAVGETVKVGDKFGLWITSMILPDERFWVLSSREPPQRAK